MSNVKHACLIISLVFCTKAFAQQPQPLGPVQAGATLVSLAQPIYSPLAHQADISGEVRIALTVHPNGTTEAALESGHPMLLEAALDSARKSRFECNLCSSSASYLLVYKFTLVEGPDCCTAFSRHETVKQESPSLDEAGRPQTQVIVSAEHVCICDQSSELRIKKVRSVRCLYLWKCS